MADLTITAANVVRVSGPTQVYKAGTTLTAGMPVYISDSTTSPPTVLKCLNDSAAHAAVAGITLGGASSGQPVVCLLPGSTSTITIGATVAAGTMYIVSANAGGIAPNGDLTTGEYVTDIGRAISTTQIQFSGTQWGIASA